MTEMLVATYNAIVCPIFNHAAPIWFTQIPSSHLGKLEVIQNKALSVATRCHQKATVSHLRAETGALPLMAYLELCCQQLLASALQLLHPSHLIVTSSRPLRATLHASYHRAVRVLRVRGDDPNALPPLIFGNMLGEGAYPLARCHLRGRMIEEAIWSWVPNKVLMVSFSYMTLVVCKHTC